MHPGHFCFLKAGQKLQQVPQIETRFSNSCAYYFNVLLSYKETVEFSSAPSFSRKIHALLWCGKFSKGRLIYD